MNRVHDVKCICARTVHLTFVRTMLSHLARQTLLRAVPLASESRCYQSSIASAVSSLEGQDFMSIDQLR